MKHFIIFILLILLIITLGCTMDTNGDSSSEYSFSLVIDVLKDTSDFVDLVDRAYITVLDMDDNPVLVDQKISLTKDDAHFRTGKIKTGSRDYKITKLYICDDTDNLLFYTPSETSFFKNDVVTPLPFQFNGSQNNTTLEIQAIVTNEIISSIKSNDFTVRFQTKDYNGIVDCTIKVRHNYYTLDEKNTTDGEAICLFNKTFDAYQFDFIKSGYETKTLTFLNQDVQKIAYISTPIYLLREDATIVFTENEKNINWIGGGYIDLYSFMTDTTKETYIATDFTWTLKNLNGPTLSINNEGVINFADNETGEYLITVDDKADFYLTITELKHNSAFDTYITEFENAGKQYAGATFSIATEGTLAVSFDSGDSLGAANGRAFQPSSGEFDMVVIISPDHWKFASADERELLMFHELGHTVLRRIAHETTYVNHYSASIMCATKPNEGFYNDFKELYREELFTGDMSQVMSTLENYAPTKCDLAPTRVGMGESGLKLTVANHYNTAVDNYRVKLLINGNMFFSPSNNTYREYTAGVYSSTFYVDRLPDFAEGQIIDITVIVDDENITADIDRDNNTVRTTLVWTN